MPRALKDRPKLAEHCTEPMSVFENLSGSRQAKFSGVGEIPFSEFFLYALSHGYRGADLTDLWDSVHRIDRIYVDKVTEIHKSSAPKK